MALAASQATAKLELKIARELTAGDFPQAFALLEFKSANDRCLRCLTAQKRKA